MSKYIKLAPIGVDLTRKILRLQHCFPVERVGRASLGATGLKVGKRFPASLRAVWRLVDDAGALV